MNLCVLGSHEDGIDEIPFAERWPHAGDHSSSLSETFGSHEAARNGPNAKMPKRWKRKLSHDLMFQGSFRARPNAAPPCYVSTEFFYGCSERQCRTRQIDFCNRTSTARFSRNSCPQKPNTPRLSSTDGHSHSNKFCAFCDTCTPTRTKQRESHTGLCVWDFNSAQLVSIPTTSWQFFRTQFLPTSSIFAAGFVIPPFSDSTTPDTPRKYRRNCGLPAPNQTAAQRLGNGA